VDLRCRPGDVARLAASQCAAVCRQELGEAPEVRVLEGHSESYALIPGYLLYILREVIKNACHATVKRHVGSPLPPVLVSVEHDACGATISVSDEAGGMTGARLQDAWRFLHTTAEPKCDPATAGDGDEPAGGGTELAGFGVGLPKSRLYARFFGDDLALNSVPGEGTEARLTIRGDGACRSEIGFGSVVPLSVLDLGWL
jgi:signal transduction histidine kinase